MVLYEYQRLLCNVLCDTKHVHVPRMLYSVGARF